MREITLKYEFGTGYDFEITPTAQDLYEFLEYYSEYKIKKDGFEFLSSVLGIDLEEVVFDFSDVVRSDYEYWLKEKYEEKAYEDYQEYVEERWRMKSRNYY